MSDSKFWRALAVAAVVGLFYLGDALRDGKPARMPTLISKVQAGDVGISEVANSSRSYIVTSSDEGDAINVWQLYNSSSNVRFVGKFRGADNSPDNK